MRIGYPPQTSSPPAKSVLHQRIGANTDAMMTLATAAAAIAQATEPRVARIETSLPSIEHRVTTLENLPHRVAELGHDINRRINDSTRTLHEQIKTRTAEGKRRIDALAAAVRAIQDSMAEPTWRDAAIYATATNGDGSFDGRTTLGTLFIAQRVAGTELKSVADVARLPRPGVRAEFIRTMQNAFAKLPSNDQSRMGPLVKGDWGRLFDCAPELARTFAAAHPAPPGSPAPAA